MLIHFDTDKRFFHLSTDEMSYAFGVAEDGRLRHLYWGAALKHTESLYDPAKTMLQAFAAPWGVDCLNVGYAEWPTQEPFDYGDPVLWVRHEDGVRGLRLVYERHTIEDDHLTVFAKDEAYPVSVELHYRGWENLPLLSKWLVIRNEENAALKIEQLKSAAWHLPAGEEYRLTHLSGQWGCEYTKNQLMLTQSRTVLHSNRLTCTTAQQTPFFALDQDGAATEENGNVYYGVLHWSGNFDITIERQFGKRVSVTGGVNSFDTCYMLKPGEQFETPWFTGGFSAHGFEHMSETLYDWQLDHLMPRGEKTDKAHAVRPVIYNSWYPYEFDVREDRCLALIDKCAALGVELFVLDDGWMTKRTSGKAGLGDWVADEDRFPHGLQALAKACHERGLQFGLWVEPEMVNVDSELYRAHPEWVIRDPTRPMTLQRDQLVLNLARDDVRDWAMEWLDRLIENCQLDYLKWDMNRYATDVGWPDAPQQEKQTLSIRYTRNLLAIWEHLNQQHPDVLYENCASGGGRADFGMVPYADRINRSDNADPVDVMVLHEGFTMLFPPKTAGGAGNIAPARHPIHQRATPLSFRIHLGMTGSMSIGINLLTASKEEMDELKKAIAEFKRLRADLHDAYVYRIASATQHPYALFQYVRRDRKAFTLFSFAHGMRCWDLPMPRFRMRGLLPDAVYECEDGRRMTGEALMAYGLQVQLKGDCDSHMERWVIE